jgi:hypothetical protein
MIPWVFDSRLMVEWEDGDLDSRHAGLPRERHLISRRLFHPDPCLYPENPLLHYREYLDQESRRTVLAWIEVSKDAARTADLVDDCWMRALPVVLWFSSPPNPASPAWYEAARPRSVSGEKEGRLLWRPLISWRIEGRDEALRGLERWLANGDSRLGPQLLRLEFQPSLDPGGLQEVLAEVGLSSLPCHFKILAFPDGRITQTGFDWQAHLERLDAHCCNTSTPQNIITWPGP